MKTFYVDHKMGRPWVVNACPCLPGDCWDSSGVFQSHFAGFAFLSELLVWGSMIWARQTESRKLSPPLFRERVSHENSTVTGPDLCKLSPVEMRALCPLNINNDNLWYTDSVCSKALGTVHFCNDQLHQF